MGKALNRGQNNLLRSVNVKSRLSLLHHAHINMLGHFTFTLAEQVTKGQLRPPKQAEESDEWPL